MIKVTSNIYQISGAWWTAEIMGSNVILLIDRYLTLVDTGFTGSVDQLMRSIKLLGYSPSDIANIILTHHHPDHMSGLAAIKRIAPARVMAHSGDAPYINGQVAQPGPVSPDWLKWLAGPFCRLWATRPVNVDVELKDEDKLPICGGISIIHTPGHTPGSITLYVPAQKLIIVGDLVVHGDKIGLPSREFTIDKGQELKSIQRVADKEFDIMCFGHGPPILGEAHFQMKEFVASLERGIKANQ